MSSHELTTADVDRIVSEIRPDWTVEAATPAEAGHTPVYHLTVSDDTDGTREYVLKAAPAGETAGIPVETRLLALLDARTSIPVPGIVGVLDAHPEAPAPAFLMASMSGQAVPQRDVDGLADETVGRLARDSGRLLAELHGLDVVAGFGYLDCDQARALQGGRPPTDGRELVVADPASWPEVLGAWVAHELENLADTEYAGLAERVRGPLEAAAERVPTDVDPVFARIDHGVHNFRFDPETGALTAALDWAFTLAASPGYDLATVAYVLAGGPTTALQRAEDRRSFVRTQLEAGYRDAAGRLPDDYTAHRRTYDLLMLVRSLNHLQAGQSHVRPENVEEASEGTREQALELLADGVN